MANPDHDPDPHDGPDNDNHGYEPETNVAAAAPAGGAVAAAPAGGALVSLEALATALGKVDTASVLGHSGKPMLQFKREGSGTWSYGQKRIVVEEGSRWAVNPLTFKRGFICFGDGNKRLGEVLIPVSQPAPDVTQLPDKGAPWTSQWAVEMKCTSGTDAGLEVIYKPTTVGGTQAVAGLIEAVRDRLSSGQHNGAVAPIVTLNKDFYDDQYGRVWTPLLRIIGWMPLSGPAPAPAPASPPPPVEQPRRRRVA